MSMPAPPPNPPVVALLGAGGIAVAHLAGWAALGAQIRIYSVAGAADLAAGTPGAVAVGSLEEAFDGADVADVCTPTTTHPALVLAAVERGLDVVCEKPLARTALEALRVARACEAAGVKLFPAHVVRWFGEYELLARRRAELGTLAAARFTRTGAAPGRDWFFDVAASGGIVMDQMIHDLDQARWHCGEVTSVFARSVARDRVVTAQVVMQHEGGAVSQATGIWGPPGTEFHYSYEVAGTGGLLAADNLAHPELRLDVAGGAQAPGGSRGLLPAVTGRSPYEAELADFLAWQRGGPAPRVCALDGVAAVALAEAAIASIETGAPVVPATIASLDARLEEASA